MLHREKKEEKKQTPNLEVCVRGLDKFLVLQCLTILREFFSRFERIINLFLPGQSKSIFFTSLLTTYFLKSLFVHFKSQTSNCYQKEKAKISRSLVEEGVSTRNLRDPPLAK